MNSTHLTGKHLYLTGYRGCGKTSVAKILADQLHCDWVDLDDLVEQQAGKSIREIFVTEQEIGFRDRETECLTQLASLPQAFVVALGGGAILRSENRSQIKQTGLCVWLDADPDVIATRLARDATTDSRRPALTDLPAADEIRSVMQTRRPLYESAADHRVETTKLTPDQVAEHILAWWQQEGVGD